MGRASLCNAFRFIGRVFVMVFMVVCFIFSIEMVNLKFSYVLNANVFARRRVLDYYRTIKSILFNTQMQQFIEPMDDKQVHDSKITRNIKLRLHFATPIKLHVIRFESSMQWRNQKTSTRITKGPLFRKHQFNF